VLPDDSFGFRGHGTDLDIHIPGQPTYHYEALSPHSPDDILFFATLTAIQI
jgi:hypothetical protein